MSDQSWMRLSYSDVPATNPPAGKAYFFVDKSNGRWKIKRADGTIEGSGNTLLHGSGAPSNLLGLDDDYYLDSVAYFLYGPKAGGVWPPGVSLTGPVQSVFGRQGAVTAQGGDYTAGQVTNVPAGGVAAVTVQAAIDELDAEKVPTTRLVSAGSGLTGGGDLSADRTVSMPAVGTAGTYGAADTVPVVTTDAQGRVSGVVPTAIAILSAAVTNFAATVRATVLTGFSVGANAAIAATDTVLQAFGKAQGQLNALFGRTISAGAGLTGGGDLSADRTISMPNTGTAGTYGTAASVPVITTDAQGRVSGVTPTAITGVPAANITNAPAGNVSAGTVQGAINELDSEKVPTTRTVSAGTGLSGGGDLSADRTISMPNVGTAGTYGTAAAVSVVTTDAQGRVSAATTTAITGVPAANIVNTPAGNIAAGTVQGALNELDSEKQAVSEKGQPNGYASLDGGGKVPTAQLPSYVDDVLEYANLAAFPATGETGKIYVAIDTGKTYRWTGSIYVEISASEVNSVYGRTGIVTAQSGDYSAAQVTNTPAGTISSTDVQAAINELDTEKVPTTRTVSAGTGLSGGGTLAADRTISMPAVGTAGSYGSATSVPVVTTDAQGRVSSVTPTTITGVPAANIANTPAGTISATDVQTALNELDTEKVPTTRTVSAGAGLSGGGDLSANRTVSMPNVGTAGTYGTAAAVAVVTTDAQGRVSGASTTAITGVPAANITNTPAGTIAATDVQTALNELDTEKVPTTRSVSAGTGLSGGGTLAADRTISMPNVGTAGTYGDAGTIPVITTDAQGRVSGVTPTVVQSFDQSNYLIMTDDFHANSEATAVIGQLGWLFSISGAGSVVRKAGISGHPGIITVKPGTAANTRGGIGLGGDGVNTMVLGGGVIEVEYLVRSAAVLTQLGRIAIGLGDTVNLLGTQVNGVFFELLGGVTPDTNWFLVSASASSRTRVDTGIAYAANTWIKLKFTVNAGATSIQATINGTNAGSALTTTIPTTAISPLVKLDGAAGGVSSDTDIDYFRLRQTFTSAR